MSFVFGNLRLPDIITVWCRDCCLEQLSVLSKSLTKKHEEKKDKV